MEGTRTKDTIAWEHASANGTKIIPGVTALRTFLQRIPYGRV